ncbi:MAG: VTT domain-containing protein [Bacilli bacterium]
MVERITKIINILVELLQSAGPLAGFFLIILESIIPILPLSVFIAFNNLAFGSIIGFIISLIGTICGCLISFYAFRLGFSKILYRNMKIDGKIHNLMKRIKSMSFSLLVILIALPFTPAFLINIVCGLSKMEPKKFLLSILIGKISIVYFWGYVGTGLIESLQNPKIFLEIIIILLVAYAFSRVIQKILKVNEVK